MLFRSIASLREGTLKFAVRDWDNPVEVNAELRNLWQRIELEPDMQPVRAVWNIGQSPAEREMDESPGDLR